MVVCDDLHILALTQLKHRELVIYIFANTHLTALADALD